MFDKLLVLVILVLFIPHTAQCWWYMLISGCSRQCGPEDTETLANITRNYAQINHELLATVSTFCKQLLYIKSP